MRAHKKIRALRAMAIASCIAGLAVPAGAGAMPLGPSSSRAAAIENSQAHTGAADQTGARLDHRGLNATKSTTFVLPGSFKTDAQSSPYTSPSSSAPSAVVREIKTVTNDTDHTLAILLASCALGIALCGTGYVAVRLTRLQRAVGSGS